MYTTYKTIALMYFDDMNHDNEMHSCVLL